MTKRQLFGWRTLMALVAGAGIATSIASPAWAVLYAYEGFSGTGYTPGAGLAGLSGGTGWDLPANDPTYTQFVTSPGWQGMTRNNASIELIAADTIQAGSLAYADTFGNTLVTSGNHLLNTPGAGGTAASQGGRFLSQRRSTGSTWISFMVQRQGDSDNTPAGGLYPRGANLALFDATFDGTTPIDRETIDIGPNNSNAFLPVAGVDEDRYQLRIPTVNGALTEANLPNKAVTRPTPNTNGTNQVQNAFTEVQRQALNFFVMRIDHLGTAMDGDDVRIWMNPRLDQTPNDTSVSAAYIHADIVAAATAQTVAPYGNYPAQSVVPGGTAEVSLGDQAFTRFRLFAGQNNGPPHGEIKLDEIRIGSTYADVAPFTPGGQDGDYNKNGRVDAADYVVWREAQLTGATSLDNRGPFTGTVGPDDYTFWRSKFGDGTGPAAGTGTTIPEPHSVVLLVLAIAALGAHRQTRCRG